jgi:hypothetical protein
VGRWQFDGAPPARGPAERPRPSGKKGSGWLERKKRMGRCWAERMDGPDVTGKKILFRIKFDFEYTMALEICTRRFRRNFDMKIFPKFF